MHYYIALLLAMGLMTASLKAQNAHKLLRSGDQQYQKGEYTKAEEEYRKSLARSGTANGHFNLGNAVYRQERFPEAVRQYEEAALRAPTASKKAEAYHNLGNAHFESGNLEKSVEAYKNALRNNPSDLSSKYNLVLAQKKLQQRVPPPPSPQQQQDPTSNQPPPPPGNQNAGASRNEPPPSPQSGNPRPGEEGQQLSREEAEALLRIAGQEEKKVQSKLRKAPGQEAKSKKDW